MLSPFNLFICSYFTLTPNVFANHEFSAFTNEGISLLSVNSSSLLQTLFNRISIFNVFKTFWEPFKNKERGSYGLSAWRSFIGIFALVPRSFSHHLSSPVNQQSFISEHLPTCLKIHTDSTFYWLQVNAAVFLVEATTKTLLFCYCSTFVSHNQTAAAATAACIPLNLSFCVTGPRRQQKTFS